MLIEYTPRYDDDTIKAATENMQLTMHNFNTVIGYAAEIQDAIALYPEGKAELHRLARAAQIIVGTEAEGPEYRAQAQAVYSGELLAMELINSLEPGVGVPLKTGFAQSFITRMVQSGLTVLSSKDSSELSRKHEYYEPFVDQRRRLDAQGKSLQAFLTSDDAIEKISPLYEEFGQQSIEALADKKHRPLALAGFRMIIIEALKSWSTKKVTEDEIRIAQDELMLGDIEIAEQRNNLAQQALKAISGEPNTQKATSETQSENAQWEKVDHLPRNIMKFFAGHESSLEDTEEKSNHDIRKIEDSIEQALQKFNTEYDLFTEDDLIAASGNMFIIEYNEAGEGVVSLVSDAMEIIGTFENIYLTEVPTKRQLRDTMAAPELSENILQDGQLLMPVIRITKPMRTTTLNDDEVLVEEYDFEQIIDIPLNYRGVSYRRIKLDELEEEL